MHKDDIRKTGPTTDRARIEMQIEHGKVDASADAARRIAKRIEDEGGFWGKRKP